MKLSSKPTYEDYKKYMKSIDYIDKLITENQTNSKIFITKGKAKYDCCSCAILHTKIPYGDRISVDTNYCLKIELQDENGKEIPNDTKIRIIKHETSATIKNLTKSPFIHYSDVKCGYKFDTFFEVTNPYHISILLNNVNILIKNIEFEFTFDYWTKE